MATVTPMILAAGTSSRMGRPKALLPFGDETCLSLVLRACQEGGAGPPVVVLGADAGPIRAMLPPGTSAPANLAFRETGPAASLKVGLDHLPGRSDAFLLFPVDFPLVPASVVRELIERWGQVRGSRRIVVPSHDMRRGHPALFDVSLAPEFRALPPDGAMYRVLRSHEDVVEHLVTDSSAVLMDMDTPEDYQRCLKAYRSRAT